MSRLCFKGSVSNGAGLFAFENQFKEDCISSKAISNWPSRLLPGTLNVNIIHSDPELGSCGLSALDRNENFRPVVYLDSAAIDGNTITPVSHGAFGGDLQFWRAILETSNKGISHRCFMLRRVGSAYEATIELVSNRMLRSRFGLQNGDLVKIFVFSD